MKHSILWTIVLCFAGLYLNAQSEKEIYAFTPCGKFATPLGGGEGYTGGGNPSTTPPDYHITNTWPMSDIISVLETAPDGSTVYFQDGHVFDFSNDKSININHAITILGGRGFGGSGALITSNDETDNTPIFFLHSDHVRISGFRIKGPTTMNEAFNCDKNHYGRWLHTNGAEHIEIDNNEIYNWPNAAITVGEGDLGHSVEEVLIHHNDFHENIAEGYGYAIVVIKQGFPKVYMNVFQYQRHDIAGTGDEGSGYEAFCNLIRPGGWGHNFDMHGANDPDCVCESSSTDNGPSAGYFIHIHHNYFEDVGENRKSKCQPNEGNDYNVMVRGKPVLQCRIENNIFTHEGPHSALVQSTPDCWEHCNHDKNEFVGHFFVFNNIYKLDKYYGWYVRHDWDHSRSENYSIFGKTYAGWTSNLENKTYYDSNSEFHSTPMDNTIDIMPGDFDGDGKTDILKAENGTWWMLPFDATNGYNQTWQSTVTSGYLFDQVLFGNFNNNATTDVFRTDGGNWYISEGANTAWAFTANSGYSFAALRVGDFEADNVDDIWVKDGSQWQYSDDANSSWANLATSGYPMNVLGFGQFGGNNRTDVFLADGTNFRFSDGAASSWMTSATSGFQFPNLQLADFNSDGNTDVISYDLGLYSISLGGSGSWTLLNTLNFPYTTLGVYGF